MQAFLRIFLFFSIKILILAASSYHIFRKIPYIYFIYPQSRKKRALDCKSRGGRAVRFLKHLFKRKDFPFIITAFLLGSLWHFFYEFSDYNAFTALIAPVSESTWEHLKLIFFPLLLLGALEYEIRKPPANAFFAARFAGVLSGMLIVVVLFYVYTFALGRNYLALDILVYFIAVLMTYVISGHLVRRFRRADSLAVFFCWFTFTLLFFSFTCYPPEFGIFLPPQ